MSELKDMTNEEKLLEGVDPKTEYIVIGFSTPKHPTIISRLIRRVEGTPYSHVYTKARSNSLERTLVYHASESNLHFMNFDVFSGKNEIYEEFCFKVTPEIKKKVLQFCVDMAGRHYGRLEFIGIGWVRLNKIWFNRHVSNPFRDAEVTMVCSELAGWCLKLLGEDFDVKILEEAGPKWVYNRCVDMCQRGLCERYSRHAE